MGAYCFNCGQHAHESARSTAALFNDAWHIATHVDSRFWQTLYILLCRPGKLTREYFAEHRARYLPPVRVYLVLSVLFFAFGLAAPHKFYAVSTQSGAAPTVGEIPAAKAKGFLFNVSNCDQVNSSISWLQNALHQSCLRNIENHGALLQHAFVANIPKMMFLFVPMMALVMLMLYWWPRRWYVEHLVFFLHNHAAVFLLLLIQALLSWVAAWLGWRTFRGWVIAIITCYTIWYVYRAMRVYYGQGRLLTFTKLCVVGMAYMIGFSLTLFATLLVSVLMD
ncbi:MAG TPA: DUF3667 domain-containing protein [Steroidobacteraceae bacterium]|jgi:hypothetical protein|nr:DUF3667 domain-containing protein [Steroidobacteraceae bacterium]